MYLRRMIQALRKLLRKRMPQKRILMYGLQRSGTNYMEALIKLNYPDVQFLNGIVRNEITHKHFRLYPQKHIIPEPQFANTLNVPDLVAFEKQLPFAPPDLYLVVSKDPIGWYSSYMKWSKKNNWPPHAHHYIEEYTLFYGMWKDYAAETDRILFVRYDDLLTAPETVLQQVGAKLGYPPLQKFRNTRKVYASRRFTAEKKQAHLSGAHKQVLSADDLQAIRTLTDPALLTFMGYTI